MKPDLNNRVILVTGGSSGIGRATAFALAAAGARIVIADIDVDGGNAVAAAIRARGGDASFFAADVRHSSEVDAMLSHVVAIHGRLDGAFNNAGVLDGTFTSTAELSEDVWDRVVEINLRGVWLCMRREIPLLLGRGGVIVNHASVAGLYGNRLVGAAYIASKHGVVGLTRAAALEYADRGIRVNAICPGIVEPTTMSDVLFGVDPAQAARIKALYPMGRVGTPEEVAEVVCWLFSDASAFVTGHALPIDGGLLAA